ncbi:MAG: DUF2125 domain-containing protein [Pseudomonadota bacterium]
MSDRQPATRNGGGPRGFAIFMFIAVSVLLAAYTAFWFYMRGELEKGIDEWIATERLNGAVVEFDEKRLGGFPFRFALHLENPNYRDARGIGGWSGEELQLIMQPWNWQHVMARAPGANRALFNGEETGLTLGPKAVGSVSWTQAGLRRLSIDLDDAEVTLASGETYAATGLQLHMRPPVDDVDALQIVFQWEALTLPQAPPDAPFLGESLQPSRLLLEIKDVFSVLQRGGGVSDWIAAGGEVNVAQVLLNWGPLKFGAKADLSIDSVGLLNGSVDIRLDDGDALTAAMLDSGMDQETFMQASAAVSMLGVASRDGGFLPLSIREGEVRYLGQTLVEIPSLTAPGAGG